MLKNSVFLSFILFFIPTLSYSNSIAPSFFTDQVGRVYNEKDFQYKIIASECASEHSQVLPIDPSRGASRNGVKHVEYRIREQTTGMSQYFLIPQEKVVSFKYGFDSMNKGEIRLPLNYEIPKFTNSIVMYIKGEHSLDKISFVVSEDGITRLYSFNAFEKETFGLFAFPLTRNKKVEKRVLKGIIITHYQKIRLKTDIVLSLGELHFVSWKTNRIKQLRDKVPFFTPITMDKFGLSNAFQNGPKNLSYPSNALIFWPYKQSLSINLETSHPLLLEIYGVLEARVKKSFLMRLKLPRRSERQCIKIELPDNLIDYSTQKHNNSTMLLHGIKLIPLMEGIYKDREPRVKINGVLFRRKNFV